MPATTLTGAVRNNLTPGNKLPRGTRNQREVRVVATCSGIAVESADFLADALEIGPTLFLSDGMSPGICRHPGGRFCVIMPMRIDKVVQPELLAHGEHRPAKQVHIATSIVSAEDGVLQAEARFHMVQRMPGAPGFAEEHLGHVNGVDAVHVPCRQSMAAAGDGEELGVESPGRRWIVCPVAAV